MGAGAVGGYYGALLARAGHRVTLVGREELVEAVRRHGLRLQTSASDERVSVAKASTEASAVRGAGLVLCCVKSHDTEAAADALAPHLEPGALVLSLQNGVDNAARLRSRLRTPVTAAVVYVAVEMAGPGYVRHHGRGELVLDAGWAGDARLAAFAEAGVPLEYSDNLPGALWSKLILNCAYNALSAVARCPYGRLLEAEGVPEVMRDVVDECLAVAEAEGVRVPGDAWAAVERIARTMPAQLSSTAQDLALGRATEIGHLNGHVVRRGRALGVPVPVNQVLLSLVRLLEREAGARA